MVAGRSFQRAADEVARQKHAEQLKDVEASWTDWLASHTKDGRLVSVDPATGELVPLGREALARELERRDQNRSLLARDKAAWEGATTAWGAALDKFLVVNVDTLETQEEIDAAEAEADAALRKALELIGAVAAGAFAL